MDFLPISALIYCELVFVKADRSKFRKFGLQLRACNIAFLSHDLNRIIRASEQVCHKRRSILTHTDASWVMCVVTMCLRAL